MGIQDDLTCLLRNLYAGQETMVRTGHRTADWFCQKRSTTRLLSPCLFNLYVGYIMRNAGLDEAQAGVKTAERNININKVRDFIFLDSKITVDGDSGHEIQRCLLLGRKSKTNLDSILKLLVGMQTSTATMENSVEIP